MLKNYIKNTPKKEDIPEDVIDTTFQILDKCIKLKDRNAPLMSKVLDIGTMLYPIEKYKPLVNNLKLLKSINNDIPKFKDDHQYLNSALNCISVMSKDDPFNGQEAVNCGLFQNLNNEVSKLLKDGPEKYEEKKKPEEDPNGYLKTCFNLAKLYNSLIRNDMQNVDKFNKLGVTDNTIKMLDTFNDKIQPLTEEEKEAEDERKAHLLKSVNAKKKPPVLQPIQCIKLRGDELENIANKPKKYTTEELFKSPDQKPEEEMVNPDYYYIKILEDSISKPSPGIEKIDAGDDRILIVKISRRNLDLYANPDIPPDQQSKVRHLFKEADEKNIGVECFYRKVLTVDLDKPETAKLTKIPLDTDVDELYNRIKKEQGDFKPPEEGIQLVKCVGSNVDPKELNKHITDVKKLYTKKDKEGHSSGTTVQCVKVNRPNKEGKKEPVQFIKAVRGGAARVGQEPISYYRVGGNTDLRQLLEDIQTTGVPKGKEGVDYIKVKGDKDLEEAQNLFKGTEMDPKTYYYTSVVKGDSKGNGKGKINSVTVLSDPTNRINKKSQVAQVFRKAEDANEKQAKDNDKYYYTKVIGDNNKDVKPLETTRDTNMKDIYGKLKGDLSINPEDEEFIFLIKVKGDKTVNDALNKIKLSGALTTKPDKPEDQDLKLNKIRGNTKIKEIYTDVKKPNGALLIKAPKDNDLDDIVNQVKNSKILKADKKPPVKSDKKPEKGTDKGKPAEGKLVKPEDVMGKPQKVKGNDNMQYILLSTDELSKCDKPQNLGTMFKPTTTATTKKKDVPEKKPTYLYRKISNPPKPDDSDLKPIQGKTTVDDFYKKLRNDGFKGDKPKEGVQVFKTTGKVENKDYTKHIKESEKLYKVTDGEETGPIRAQSVTLYPRGKDAGEFVVYLKITGGNLPERYYKISNTKVDLDEVLKQIGEKGEPQKDGKPYDKVTGDELNRVKTYFKPKDDDVKQPKKENKVDDKEPKAYFYTTKVPTKEDKDNPSIINSVTLLSDPQNNLNKGQNIEQLFTGPAKTSSLTTYYFAPFTAKTKDDDNIQLQKLNGKTKINEVFDKIKNYGAKINKEGDGIQLIKTTGTVGTNDMAQHLTEARNNSKQPGEDGTVPSTYYYKTKVLGSGEKGVDLEGERKGKVDSCTIKRDPDNDMFKGKDIETVLKEGEEEDEQEKLPGEVVYYYARIKGGVIDKPEEVKLIKGTAKTKLDDIYKEVKKLGPMEKNDGIQIFKVTGDVDNESLVNHVKEAGELFNNPEDDKKSDEPTSSYYTTEVFGENVQKKDAPGGKESGIIQSITVRSDDQIKNKPGTLGQLFNKEEGNDDDDEETVEVTEEIVNPVYYYTKLKGGKADKPEDNLQIVKIKNDTKMSDLKQGDNNTIVIKAADGVKPDDIKKQMNKLGVAYLLTREGEEQPKKLKGETEERKKAIQFSKISGNQLSSLASPDLVQKYKVEEMFSPVDPEEAQEDPNPQYYYTKVISAQDEKAKEDPVLSKVKSNAEMSDVYKYVTSKGGSDGVLLVQAPEDTKEDEIIEHIKTDGLNLKKPEDTDDDEITTSIYYTTEEILYKPKEVPKVLEGNTPVSVYVITKPEDKDKIKKLEEGPTEVIYDIIPEDNESADEKIPKEMVRDIMKYTVGTLDQLTVAPVSNEYLAKKTTFGDTITKALQNDNNDTDLLLTGLHSLGNYLYKENGPNYSKLDLPKTYELLHDLQSKYYANPEILTQVNTVSGTLVKNLKDDKQGKEYTKRFYDLIPESTKCQDHNPDLVLLSLKLMNAGLDKKPYLIDQTYDTTIPDVLSILKLYKDNAEIQEAGYGLLSHFGKNKIYASCLINNGLLPTIQETLENALFSDTLSAKNKPIRAQIFKLLSNISKDPENAPKVADEVMGQLIEDLNDKGYGEESNGKEILQLLDNLLGCSQCVAPFVQFGGIDACINLLDKSDTNTELAMSVFSIFKKVSEASDDYKRILQEKKLPDLVNRIIKKVGAYDKKIEFEGRQLVFNVNLAKVELEDPDKINVHEIKITEPIPPPVRNFLTSGKQIKAINEEGEIKPMQLIFSQDLMKVSLKKIKSDLPPKPKYIIDTITIKKILKGHGTDAFKKSTGLFRSIPNPELCFTIIGPTTVDGLKAFNVVCETEKEVDKWIEYLQIVINYFKKTHAIKGNVLIKK